VKRHRLIALALVAWLALGPALSAWAQSGGESIGGVLRNQDGRPVAGVTLSVKQHGATIASGTTGPDGSWQIPVPGPGLYAVTIDTSTLPKGVRLTDPSRKTLSDVTVQPGQSKIVLFPLGKSTSHRPSRISSLINLTIDGLKLGSVVALASVGLSLIFGVTGLVNFAHGELVTFGAVVAFFFSTSAAGPRWGLVVAALAAVIVGGLFGGGLELGLWRPLRRRRAGNVSLIVVAIGLSLLVRHLILLILKGAPRQYREFTIQHPWRLGGVSVLPKDAFIIVASLVVLVLVGVLLQRTRLGTAMRAVADDKDLAESSGIDVDRVILATWIGGAGLAALGGVFYGITQSIVWDMGFTLLLTMFAAVILGGLGSAYGAMAGGLVIGIASEVSTYWLPVEFKEVVSLTVLIVVLLFRPQGILGVRERLG